MAIKRVWYDSRGPFRYDDASAYQGDPAKREYDPTLRTAIRTEGQIRVETAPTDADHVVRQGDIVTTGLKLLGNTTLDCVGGSEVSLYLDSSNVTIPMFVICKLLAGSGVTTANVPTISVGSNAGRDNIMPQRKIQGLITVGNAIVAAMNGLIICPAAAVQVYAKLVVASGAGVYSLDVRAYGATTS